MFVDDWKVIWDEYGGDTGSTFFDMVDGLKIDWDTFAANIITKVSGWATSVDRKCVV